MPRTFAILLMFSLIYNVNSQMVISILLYESTCCLCSSSLLICGGGNKDTRPGRTFWIWHISIRFQPGRSKGSSFTNRPTGLPHPLDSSVVASANIHIIQAGIVVCAIESRSQQTITPLLTYTTTPQTTK